MPAYGREMPFIPSNLSQFFLEVSTYIYPTHWPEIAETQLKFPVFAFGSMKSRC